MVIFNELAVLIVLAIFQFAAIFLTWKIGRELGHAKFWSFIIAAFILIFIRRIFSFLILFKVVSYNQLISSFDALYLPLIFWVFISIGMYDLYERIKHTKSHSSKKRRGKKK